LSTLSYPESIWDTSLFPAISLLVNDKSFSVSQGSLNTNYSISLIIIEGIRNCVPLGLG